MACFLTCTCVSVLLLECGNVGIVGLQMSVCLRYSEFESLEGDAYLIAVTAMRF